jgi:hypothetical protein
MKFVRRQMSVAKLITLFYENKTALVLSIFNEVADEAFANLDEVINYNLSFSEKLIQIFEYKYKSTKDFSTDFVADFYHPRGG